MFVKLDATRILDMSTGTRYVHTCSKNSPEYNQIEIVFNGPQADTISTGLFARDLWNFLCNQAAKLGEEG